MTCKTLTEKLNTNDIKVVKENGYYIIKCGRFESEFTYTLKELVNEVANNLFIKMVSRAWSMNGIEVKMIKGIK